MGMETMVHLDIAGIDICARCSPNVAASPGRTTRFMAEMQNMHLIDPQSDVVIAPGVAALSPTD
jgi:multiple sugar transport system ATP-binding protein